MNIEKRISEAVSMISRIRGTLTHKSESSVVVEIAGISYTILIPATLYPRLPEPGTGHTELITYHYHRMGKQRSYPVLIGFCDELEKEFFEKFIGVSGIGPKAALRAFDKPVSFIARAIEEGNVSALKTLAGIGTQKAKQIVAHLQGKVGRFALIKGEEYRKDKIKQEILDEAREILKRLQYGSREAEDMVRKAKEIRTDYENVEELLNEIYRQRK
ncbi:MAG: hypothetical protein GF333_02800 [Candidatus Omnitrophica bacterium]|nr:hypothetical protein [Candidatus Omnitrophota bacterium]